MEERCVSNNILAVIIIIIIKQIHVSSIDFWESHLEEYELELMHRTRVYPPRLEMTVQILNVETQHIKLSVNFEGCKEMPKFQILLPFGNKQ